MGALHFVMAFTAAVVLQLACEHRLGLDDPVEKWLPGLVDGNGYDGSRITVRELLNHTSGIFAYTADDDFFHQGVGAAWFAHRDDHDDPAQLVRIALSHPPYAPPGQKFVYSNTDSILAAMIVEMVTGHTFAAELDHRIIRPLGSYVMGDRTGRHLLAVSVNDDWTGLPVFNAVLDAEFCPAS